MGSLSPYLRRRAQRFGLVACTSILLAACGGGGGGDALPGTPAAAPKVAVTYEVSTSVSGYRDTGLVLSATQGSGAAAISSTVPVPAGSTSVQVLSGLADGTVWSVSVGKQPSTQVCSVANGTGAIAGADNANVVVTCAYNSYSVGGSITGLTADGLVLANGADVLPLDRGASRFTLPARVAETGSYRVTVQTQPSGLSCVVNNSQGTMGAVAVTDVEVRCTDQPFKLGGSITNNGPRSSSIEGLSITDFISGGGYVAKKGDTGYVLGQPKSFGSEYSLSIVKQPTAKGLTCSLEGATGTMPAADVNDAYVTCSPDSYTLGGSVVGHNESVELLNGADRVTVLADGSSFTFGEPVAYGGGYEVKVGKRPIGQTCTVDSTGKGTMGTADITEVKVTCSGSSYSVGGNITGLTGEGLVLQNNNSDLTSVAANSTIFTMNAPVAFNGAYSIQVKYQPIGQTCKVVGASGTGIMNTEGDRRSVQVSCGPGPVVSTIASSAAFDDFDGIAVKNGVAYVAGKKGLIRKFTSAGEVSVLADIGIPTVGIAIDGVGDLYVSSRNTVSAYSGIIRKIGGVDGNVSVFAGLSEGTSFENGPPSSATFSFPERLAFDPTKSNLYVSDWSTIRKVELPTSNSASDQAVGVSSFRYEVCGGRGGGLCGLTIDAAGNIYVADTENHVILKVPASGQLTTIAGSPGQPGYADGAGSVARFNRPTDITVDGDGNLYVADTNNDRIRVITQDGKVVGTLATGFSRPRGVAVDVDGGSNVYVADTGNKAIKKITITK
jgi:hypothetical protein